MSTERKAKVYPRAIPVRAPDEVTQASPPTPAEAGTPAADSSAEHALPRRGRKLFAVVIACVVLGAGAALATGWKPSWPTSRAETVGMPAPSVPVATNLPALPSPASKPSADFAGVGPVKSIEKPLVPPAQSTSKDRYLEALGSLTAAHLYQSFLNIGLLADAVENEQMDVEEAEKALSHITRFMTLVDDQLNQLAKTDLDTNDRDALQGIRKHTELLRTQASALRSYWMTGDLDDAEMFHVAREEVWAGVSTILGLESLAPGTAVKENKVEKQ